LLPSLEEQRRIVDLVSSVDSYIFALQQQADAARVARNAVLSELLSAGGDDWTETTIGAIAGVVGGGTPATNTPEYWGGEIVWLTPTEVVPVDGQEIHESERRITSAGLKNSGAQLLPPGSVILTTRASVGFAALSTVELCTNQGFQSLIPGDRAMAKFLMFWIQVNRRELQSRAAGSTFKEISKSNVKSLKINLPPREEQQRIVDLVSSMDDMIKTTHHAVSNATRMRSGLLSDLLSGKHEIPESYDRLLGAA
jgi:type I restriction enzyme S subunit